MTKLAPTFALREILPAAIEEINWRFMEGEITGDEHVRLSLDENADTLFASKPVPDTP